MKKVIEVQSKQMIASLSQDKKNENERYEKMEEKIEEQGKKIIEKMNQQSKQVYEIMKELKNQSSEWLGM